MAVLCTWHTYGAEDKSVPAVHLCATDHLRSKKTAKVAGHPSYSSGIVNASFPIGANTAVWQESISSCKATKALRAVPSPS